ncbi:unnamed protein product [Didymodactylos carnosus]|uniref:G-protein coupled receptors family 1 profile domain-containing protein n=1 Tax=Didymodactylos carnosus TaxID=1234261 RepID=A0A814W1U3_9BILA|nr:unnamed protein product [Didymodactylos carnosus]CAF1196259.1 unnamed protein product [Didymodactylos carnosus]CAF3897717.1 unnamed protein product [Didymodactylos carnosus]CAF3960632.1 unnamed protein product [Didymodactylos carnosus]
MNEITNITDLHPNNDNPCPNLRQILRPVLYIHNYSIFLFGSISNFLAFGVLMQKSLRRHSTFAYLALLSLSNALLSIVRFSQYMFAFYWKLTAETGPLFFCRFYRFGLDTLTHFSLFTLIAVNIDRARTVTITKRNAKYKKSEFKTVLLKELILVSALCLIHLHWLLKFGHVPGLNGKRTLCSYEENRTSVFYLYFLRSFYPPFELAVFFCIPLFINIFCTIIIVRSLRLRMQTAKRYNSKSSTVVSNRPKLSLTSSSTIHRCFCCLWQCRKQNQIRLKFGRTKQNGLMRFELEADQLNHDQTIEIAPIPSKTKKIETKQMKYRRTRDLHLSAMLIALNILFLFMNLPYNIYVTFIVQRLQDICLRNFIQQLLDILQITFFSSNFFLYVLTNRRFREEFYNAVMKLLSKALARKRNRNIQMTNTTGSTATTNRIEIENGGTITQNHDSTGSQDNENENIFISKLVMYKNTYENVVRTYDVGL